MNIEKLNKKHYIAPAMEEIALNHCTNLLNGSAEQEDYNGEFGMNGFPKDALG